MTDYWAPKAYPIHMHDLDGKSLIPERFWGIASLVDTGQKRTVSREQITLPQIAESLWNPLMLDVTQRSTLDFLTEIWQWYTGILQLMHGIRWSINDLIISVQTGWSGIKCTDKDYYKVFHTGSEIFYGRAGILYYLIHLPVKSPLDLNQLSEEQRSQPDWVKTIHTIF